MNKNIKRGQVWVYVGDSQRKHREYIIEELGYMKLTSGTWLDAVTYRSIQSGEVYTRDRETFEEKFAKKIWPLPESQ